jgi:hypothetical protein
MKKTQCPHNPEELKGQPIGMYHCPICGEMVLAGAKHPDYSLPLICPPDRGKTIS